jgi:hypothetical protein
VGTKSKAVSDKAHCEQPGADSLEQGLRILARIIALQHIKRMQFKPEPDQEHRRQIGQMELKRGNNDD